MVVVVVVAVRALLFPSVGCPSVVSHSAVALSCMPCQSDLGCNFTDTYATMQTIQMALMLAWRPLSGWITDAFAKQQHFVLLTASLVELSTLIVMVLVTVFMKNFNPWILLGLQVC